MLVALTYGVYRFVTASSDDNCKYNKLSNKNNLVTSADAIDYNVFVYNHYNVPVNVVIASEDNGKVGIDVAPGQKQGMKNSDVRDYLKKGSVVEVYTTKNPKRVGHDEHHNNPLLIGKSELVVQEDRTLKAIHVGMNTGHEDLSMAGESTKSTLGTAIPRVRLVNTMPKVLTLTIGSDTVKILPNSSHLYYGENHMGIHLGVIVRDQEKHLRDYVIDKPITDLHLGLISDVNVPLFNGSKFGGDFDDTVDVPNHVMEIYGVGGPHNGMFADRSYIP